MSQVTTATNLQGPDLSSSTTVDARKYFNNFYADTFNVSASLNDSVIAFFEQYTQNKSAAKNLAAAVIYTALAQKLNPMAVLEDFQRLPKGQLDAYLIAFLNINRIPTSLLGLKSTTNTSPYVSRSIIV